MNTKYPTAKAENLIAQRLPNTSYPILVPYANKSPTKGEEQIMIGTECSLIQSHIINELDWYHDTI